MKKLKLKKIRKEIFTVRYVKNDSDYQYSSIYNDREKAINYANYVLKVDHDKLVDVFITTETVDQFVE